MNAALDTHELSIGYSHRGKVHTVADSINLSLHPGKLTCLMGPNGIGKSTLIKTITGVLSPLSGSLSIVGNDLPKLTPLERAQSIAIVLTEKPDIGFMTVTDLISLGRFPHTNWSNNFTDKDSSKVVEAINNVGLNNLKDSPLAELSDGNLQKAIIGRALAQDTDIIVLDEPTIHLDVNNRLSIIKLLRRLSREFNKAILLSTHDLDLAMSYTDRLWLFSESSIIEGLPEDLYLKGDLDKVFAIEDEKKSPANKALDTLNIIGSTDDIHILKQAIAKQNLESSIDKNSTIQINYRENIYEITYKQNIYLSIEDFLDNLTS